MVVTSQRREAYHGHLFQLGHPLIHSRSRLGERNESIKVVILKKDNEPEVMRLLMEEAGPKPERPPSCAEDALKYVQQQGEVLGPDLRAYLQSLGHHPPQINIYGLSV